MVDKAAAQGPIAGGVPQISGATGCLPRTGERGATDNDAGSAHLQPDTQAATLMLSRMCAASLAGGSPKNRAYSRVN